VYKNSKSLSCQSETTEVNKFWDENMKKRDLSYCKGKGKAVSSEAWSGPEGSRNLRFADFMTTAQDGGKVASLMHRPPLTPRKCSWYSFMLEAESTPGL